MIKTLEEDLARSQAAHQQTMDTATCVLFIHQSIH